MSEKVRVMFRVPPECKHSNRLVKPVDIPLEKYVEFRMDEQRGYKNEMAVFVAQKFLKGELVEPDSIEMITAVGNPTYLLDIDQQIENGINPLENADEGEDAPVETTKKYEESSFLNSDKSLFLFIGGIIAFLILLLIIIVNIPD